MKTCYSTLGPSSQARLTNRFQNNSFFKKYFIYLFERMRERAQVVGAGVQGEEEAGSPLNREPQVGCDPRTPEG